MTGAGALSLAGTDYIAPTSAMSPGTYTLFTYNSLTGSTANLAMLGTFGTNPRPGTSIFQFQQQHRAITLAVSGLAGNLLWTGSTNGTWDTATTQNWFNTTSGSADVFFTGDNVTFDDTAGTANGNVTISGGSLGAVQPASLTVNNTAVNYTFSGAPIGDGTSLVKNGAGTLTLASSNTYIGGGTSLTNGVLNANAAFAAGHGHGFGHGRRAQRRRGQLAG